MAELLPLLQKKFIYAQRVIQALHKKNSPGLFVKLDISKAVDSISWPYLLEVLEALGFSQKWRDWISSLLLTSSFKILLNGKLGERIKHDVDYDKATRYHQCCLFLQLIHYSALLSSSKGIPSASSAAISKSKMFAVCRWRSKFFWHLQLLI